MSDGGLPGVCPSCGKILKIRIKGGKAVCVCPARTVDSPMNNPESRAAFRPSYEAEPEVGAQGEIAALCVRVAP